MTNLAVNNLSLTLAFMLVLVALLVGYKEKLGIDKDIIIGVFRAVIQLFIVGYILKYVIHSNDVILTFAMMAVIILNAAWNAKKRGAGIPGLFPISLLAIVSSTGITIGILVMSGSIKFIAQQIVPISGMIASNSMVAIGLCYRNMNANFKDRRQQIIEKLALGATVKLASMDILRDSIKTGMSPTIDSAKTVGLVSLPGMMSGLIFAGVDPVKAIKYQIMVTFMLLSATSIASVISCYMAYKKFYNDRQQLVL